MVQTSVGAIGSTYWIRFHHMRARACTVAGLIGLLTGCLKTARVLSEPPGGATTWARGSGRQTDFSDDSRDPASPGPSSFGVEKPLAPLASYSEEYWTALAELDLTVLHTVARSEPEVEFAAGIGLLAAGDREKAESAFVATSRQAVDANVAVASQMMLAATLLYEQKWTTLRDLSFTSSLGLSDREHTSDPERWGHAFASVEPPAARFPEKPATLPLHITDVGTPAVKVRINGREYEFWLDTGSSMTVLSSDVATDAGVPILAPDTLRVRTFNGAAPVRPGAVKQMGIGPFAFINVPVMVMDASLMRLRSGDEGRRGPEMRVDGIVGWDVIRQLDIVLDYESRTITVKQPGRLPIAGTSSHNLTWLGNPLVQVGTKAGGTLHLRLDTGAQSTFLNASILQKLGVITKASRVHVFGIARASEQTDRVVPILTLSVAGKRLRLENAIVYEPHSSGFINSDGILGSDVAQFGKIEIDATNGVFLVGE